MKALGPILAVVATSVIGAAANFQALREWYPSLAKPAWNPPNAIFGPVWTTLYVMIAVAGVRALGNPAASPRDDAIFYLQLALNLAWSWIFFGARRPDLAFIEIVILWIAIVMNIAAFARLDRLSAWLLVPYLAWVTFASVLNFTIWRLNP